jgi:hypothetical protein
MRAAILAGSPGARTVRRIDHLQEAVRRCVVADGHELGDLGAAGAELGAGSGGSTIVITQGVPPSRLRASIVRFYLRWRRWLGITYVTQPRYGLLPPRPVPN